MTEARYFLHPSAILRKDHQIGYACDIGNQPEDAAPLRIGARAIIRSHSVIYSGSVIGDDFAAGHGVLIRNAAQIGDRVSIGSHSVIEHHVTIEGGVRIHSNVFIPEYTRIGAEAWIGPSVCITNARYPAAPQTKEKLEGVTIGRRARIGAQVTILPGVVIGDDALIGAGSVVTKDVPSGSVIAGNPAKILGKVGELRYEDGTIIYP
jgi:acetyltransferase-like isoleucine patch superfamily enzyme